MTSVPLSRRPPSPLLDQEAAETVCLGSDTIASAGRLRPAMQAG